MREILDCSSVLFDARSAAYAMRMLPIILAQVTFLSRENGGRSTLPGLNSGQYMPHLVVQPPDVRAARVVDGSVIEEDYLGVRFLAATGEPIPEQSINCEMELMYHPTVNYGAVREGATFTVREGGKVVGFGVVTSRVG